MSMEAPATTRKAGKYLTFALNREAYGIDVLKVREIIRLTHITPVPQLPTFVRGIINLRGKIVPVVDLRLRFELPEAADKEQTCIIVVQVKLPDGKPLLMGLVVDGMEEVINLGPQDIAETPDFGGQIYTDYILGIATVKGAVKTLLNIDRVLAAAEAEQLRATA